MIHLLRTCGMAVSVLVVLTGFWREAGARVIADHAAVAQFDSIPQEWIDSVKCMLLIIPGESHGRGYHYGMDLLEAEDVAYASNVTWSGTPEAYTASYLRTSRSYRYGTRYVNSCGEEEFFTNAAARANMATGLPYTRSSFTGRIAFGFGWCWDMTWHDWRGWVSIADGSDPVYGCNWDGCTVDGPQGITRWGLDAADSVLTGNSVCMQTYLDAVDTYNATEPGIITFFTTGPADNNTANEIGYQRYVKHEYIRDYVHANGGYLFDFADILNYGEDGMENVNTTGWTDDLSRFHTYPTIHPDYTGNYDGGDGGCHYNEAGCLRLAKAMWWLLARMAGWDGSTGAGADTGYVPVELSSFNARETAGGIQLTWTTESEESNLGWDIYRRLDDGVFIKINTNLIPGHGTTPQPQAYAYDDSTIPAGVSVVRYYLGQRDTGGTVTNSEVITLTVSSTGIAGNKLLQAAVPVTVFPNPFCSSVGITAVPGAGVRIYSHDGTFVRTLVPGPDGTVVWNGAGAAPGMYHYATPDGAVAGTLMKME